MTSPPPPRSRYLALPTGLTYHVLEWPHPTSETTVVLVHGFLDFAWGWRWVAQELARSFHVVAPDLRGHGDTDWIGAGGYYYFFDYLADLDALLPRLCRGNLILVGHSMGGSVASYWAGVRAGDPRRPQPAALALLEGLGPPEIAEEGAHAMPARVGRWIDQWQRARVEPSPSWPDSFAPQQETIPLSRSAQVWLNPVAIRAASRILLTRVGVSWSVVVPVPSWPSPLLPQQYKS